MVTEKSIILCGHGSGTPRTIRMDTYCTQRYSRITKNGKHKGLVAVRRPLRITDVLRQRYHDKYKTILGRNIYSQTLREYCYKKYSDGKFYSDCSSSQCKTFSAIGMDIPCTNTAGIYEKSKYFENVPVVIVNGHITNPAVLKVGDQLLFVGEDPSRPLQIGHVEGVYEINGGSGTDEAVKEFQTFLNKYYKDIIKKSIGKILTVDGDYGDETRAGALAVWKYMANKYYGANLDIKNHYFYSSCRHYAAMMTDAEIAAHMTLEEIRDGMIACHGYKTVKEYQAAKKIAGSGSMNKETWYSFFN